MEDPELAAIRARKLEKLLAERAAVPASSNAWAGPIHLTDATFDDEIRKPGLTLVDFWVSGVVLVIASRRSWRTLREPGPDVCASPS
jgi:hypothetical protein